MRTALFAVIGAGAMLSASLLAPAMAQVRGYAAVSPDGRTRVDVDVNVSVVTSDRYRDDRYTDAYYDDRRDPYYNDGYYRDQASRNRYYEDAYYRDRNRNRSYRKGEVYYPRQDHTSDVITGVLVGAIIGYAIAENNDHHHYRRSSHRYSHHDRYRGRSHKKYRRYDRRYGY